MENGYPKHFIRRLSNRHHNPLDSQPEPTAVAVLPYIQGLSDSIKRILQKDVGIKPIRPAGSLKHTLSRSKDPLPVLLRSGVVYRIPCKDCNTSYVGQTLRTLDRRIKEHQRLVVTGDTASSALAEHCW